MPHPPSAFASGIAGKVARREAYAQPPTRSFLLLIFCLSGAMLVSQQHACALASSSPLPPSSTEAAAAVDAPLPGGLSAGTGRLLADLLSAAPADANGGGGGGGGRAPLGAHVAVTVAEGGRESGAPGRRQLPPNARETRGGGDESGSDGASSAAAAEAEAPRDRFQMNRRRLKNRRRQRRGGGGGGVFARDMAEDDMGADAFAGGARGYGSGRSDGSGGSGGGGGGFGFGVEGGGAAAAGAQTFPWLPPPPPERSPPYEGQCPNGLPKQGKLQVVSDVTTGAGQRFVELVSDRTVPRRFGQRPPQPIMSSPEKLRPLCAQYGWRFCPKPNRGQEDHDWYTCEARQFVGKVHCAFVDPGTGPIPGMVFDHGRSYPVHGCHPSKTSFQPAALTATAATTATGPGAKGAKGAKVVAVAGGAVAHNLGVYPTGFAHVMAQLPRLVLLAQTIPKDVPILLAPSKARDQFVDLLHERGILDKSRVMDWRADTTYAADTVYYAGEMGRGPGGITPRGAWDTLKHEWCSWALVMPRDRLQALYHNTSRHSQHPHEQRREGRGRQPEPKKLRILVVHRKDASGQRRMLRNHNPLMVALRTAFASPPPPPPPPPPPASSSSSSSSSPPPGDEQAAETQQVQADIVEFVGNKHSLKDSVSLFASADVVVAPHGAALGFLAFMRPGAACVEIGYKVVKGMKFPAPYFMALALSVNVAYFLTMAEGAYGTPLVADIADVVAVTRKAVAYASTPGAPLPNLA